MFPTYRLVEAGNPAEFAAARTLIEEYAAQISASMQIDLCFQNFTAELEQLAEMYGPPWGCLLLASLGDEWVACGALRRFSAGTCEMKRLYIRQRHRAAKLGRQLAEQLISNARSLGYQRMVLDTLADMIAARALYRSLGFREIEPYYFNPTAGVFYMELDLGSVDTKESRT